MEQLVTALGVARLGLPIFDHTGLLAIYIYKIALSFPWLDSTGGDPLVADALEAQLGLRLEPGQERIRVLVIGEIGLPEPH